MMKHTRTYAMLIPLVLLVFVSLSPSCSWFYSEKMVTEFLTMFPDEEGISIECWNLQKLRDEEGNADIYNKWNEEYEDVLGGLGIQAAKVKRFVESQGSLRIIEGDISRWRVETAVKELGYTDDTYNGEQRWENLWGTKWVVILEKENTVIAGSKKLVMESVDLIKSDGQHSLGENEYAKAVVDRLDDGIRVVVGRAGGDSYAPLAWGYSYTNKDSATLEMKAVYRFDGKANAESKENEYKNEWDEKGDYEKVEAVVDENFVAVEALIQKEWFTYQIAPLELG